MLKVIVLLLLNSLENLRFSYCESLLLNPLTGCCSVRAVLQPPEIIEWTEVRHSSSNVMLGQSTETIVPSWHWSVHTKNNCSPSSETGLFL